jgi:hypothetical protein
MKHDGIEYFYAAATDIKQRWFINDSKISNHYIGKVIKNEMNIDTDELKRYSPFKYDQEKVGRPFMFKRVTFSDSLQSKLPKNEIYKHNNNLGFEDENQGAPF